MLIPRVFQDLVITGILTAEEFWAQHAVKNKDGGGSSKDVRKDSKTSQDVGVSGSFLSDIKPQVSMTVKKPLDIIDYRF